MAEPRETDASSEDEVRRVLAHAGAGVLVEGADRTVLLANRALCDLLGLPATADQLTGVAVADLFRGATALVDPDAAADEAEAMVRRASEARDLIACVGGPLERTLVPGSGGAGALWLVRDLRPGSEPADAASSPAATVPERPRVLVADDNPLVRTLVARLLGTLDCDCTTVEDGQQALESLRAGPWSLVLMDLDMPVLDGHAAARAWRAEEGAGHVPILALTGGPPQEEIEALRQVVDGVLTKPVSVSQLQDALATHLATAATDVPGPADATLVDTSRLLELQQQLEDVALVRLTVETFLDELPERVRLLHRAAGVEDRAQVRLLSHTLKSSSAMLGALGLSARCATVEKMAHDSEVTVLVAAVDDVVAAEHGTEAAFRAWLGASSPD